jgi:hypothetical protein
MWIPVLLKKIADIVHAETGKIQESVQYQDETARSAYDEAKSELRKVPWAAITSIILDTKNQREAAKSDHNEDYAQQDKLIFWTRLSVLLSTVVLVVYALTLLEVKKSADAAQYSAEVSDKSVLTAQRGERDSRLISEKQLAASQTQFTQTLEQMKGQTVASQKAATTAGKALSFSLNTALAEKGEPRIVIDPWVAWYYGSLYCKSSGQVCTRLTIHNTTKDTGVTGLKIAVKIAILPSTPKTYPQNWDPIPQARLVFSPVDKVVAPGYPNCVGCITYWAYQMLQRKAGTVFIWGKISYYIFGSGEVQTSPFCFWATSDQIFGIASGKDGYGSSDGHGNSDDSHTCLIEHRYSIPEH